MEIIEPVGFISSGIPHESVIVLWEKAAIVFINLGWSHGHRKWIVQTDRVTVSEQDGGVKTSVAMATVLRYSLSSPSL